MSTNKKVWLGIVAFLPIIFLVIYLAVFFSFFLEILPTIDAYDPQPQDFLPQILQIVLAAVTMGLISLGILVYFIIHSLNNTAVNKDERIVWILVFIFAGMVGFPIYWYMRIWKV